MIELSEFDRRTFLRRGAMGAGALWAMSLAPFMARRAEGAAIPSPYGDTFPTADEITGLKLLRLPAGFRYKSFSWTGDVMADDVRVSQPARRHGRDRRAGQLGTHHPRPQS